MPARIPAPTPGRAPELPPARAYGQLRSDLDFDFACADRPALVTAVLAHCCAADATSADAWTEAAWNLPLGHRIARLLRIVELSTEADALALTLRCPCADCAKPLEIAPHFAQLLARTPDKAASAEIIPFSNSDSPSLTLRLPTGRDQALWQKQNYPTTREATEAIVRSLISSAPGTLTIIAPDQIEPLASALEEADPLVTFQISTDCPSCGRAVDIAVDLELTALQKLAALRRSLLRQVHTLATRYGWGENEILSLGSVRRAEYLQLISDAEGTP